ncbi:hypothetical protein CWE13_09785 [Aliidiomarina shirensis]|uniref:Uncharacterized protein n=1 Tax=Aliidiomarina shirensis TaxID=1048642 RepID=A0A432WQV3_9GAMM|nr:hypothetical protein [Aliidiomarina shirensis]RUO36150.1 hypothetical protein CWE13_09785 [Aliidiomarina shirensis]
MDIKKSLFSFFLVIGFSFFHTTAEAQATPPGDDIFACDTCDTNKAEWIARREARVPECVIKDSPRTDPTQSNVSCIGANRTIIVANPTTEQSWKFGIQYSCFDTWCDDKNPVIQPLSLTSLENDITATFFQYHQVVRDAVYAAQKGNSFNPSGELNLFSAATGDESPQDCSASPVQYLIDDEFKHDLHDYMADAISSQLENSSFRGAVSSMRDQSRGFDITTPTGYSSSVNFNYIERALNHVISFGEPAEDNRLMFQVDYHGNPSVGGVEPFHLEFSLQRGGSVIAGRSLLGVTGDGANVNLTMSDIGCLSELLNDPSHGTTVSISEPLDSPPLAWQDLTYDVCERRTNLRTCSTSIETRQCSTTVVRDIVPCGSGM